MEVDFTEHDEEFQKGAKFHEALHKLIEFWFDEYDLSEEIVVGALESEKFRIWLDRIYELADEETDG
jgi:hypothetical protein